MGAFKSLFLFFFFLTGKILVYWNVAFPAWPVSCGDEGLSSSKNEECCLAADHSNDYNGYEGSPPSHVKKKKNADLETILSK